MKNKSVSKGIAKWLDDFIANLDKEESLADMLDTNNQNETDQSEVDQVSTDDIESKLINEEVNEKTAIININELPKVVWNDETFYVFFENDVATIFNEFGNTVTTVNATDIEEVDRILNSRQVVTSSGDYQYEEELKKFSVYLEDDEEVKLEDINVEDILNETTAEDHSVDSNTDIEESNGDELVLSETVENDDLASDDCIISETLEDEHTEFQEYKEGLSLDLVLANQMNEIKSTICKLENIIKLQNINIELFKKEIESLKRDYIDKKASEDDLEEEQISDDNKIEDDLDIENDLEVESDLDTEDDLKVESDQCTDNQDENIVKLDIKDEEIFKEAICPECGDELVKHKVVGLMQGIVCHGECKSEYAVNLETGDIFYNKQGV